MRVGFFQYAPEFGEVKRNLERVSERVTQIQCDLLVLPELFATGYQFVTRNEVETLAEPVPGGPTTTRLSELARSHGMYVVAGLPERDGARIYNSAVVVGPAGFVGCYRKTHLFFEETVFFAPGDTGFQVWDLGPVRIGVMVCFDWFYPESARVLALKGADIVCHPSNLVLPHGPDAMVTRCLENHVFSITANRTGSEERGGKKRLTYIGSSEVVDPHGQILHRASRDREELVVLDIEPAEARNKALNAYNDLLRDRRAQHYGL